MRFNLALDPWIPTDKGLMSLSHLWAAGLDVRLGRMLPTSKAALLRLLLWIDYEDRTRFGDKGMFLETYPEIFDVLGGICFLQDPDAATGSSDRPAWQVVAHEDGGSAAMEPHERPVTLTDIGLGLLTAAMVDRGGLKASLAVPSPKSAIACPMAGNYIVMRHGETVGDIIEANREFITADVADLLLWPWRRVWVRDNGHIVVAAADNTTPDTVDPFIGVKAKRWASDVLAPDFNPGSVVWEQSQGRECCIMALATMQALPLAHYERVVRVPSTLTTT